MAIFHLSFKPIQRSKGKSIVAASAYRGARIMKDERINQTFNFQYKQPNVASSELFFPAGIDHGWATDFSKVWNTAERAEKRKDACVGKEIEIGIPHELSAEERSKLVANMAQFIAQKYSVVVEASIHKPGPYSGIKNHHAHLLLSSRRITAQGFGEKTRELDDHKLGSKEITAIRKKWEELANQALARAGRPERIDCRSLKDQGIDRAPTRHMGPKIAALERKGIHTRIGDANREAVNAFAEKQKIISDIKTLDQARSDTQLIEPEVKIATTKTGNVQTAIINMLEKEVENIRQAQEDIEKEIKTAWIKNQPQKWQREYSEDVSILAYEKINESRLKAARSAIDQFETQYQAQQATLSGRIKDIFTHSQTDEKRALLTQKLREAESQQRAIHTAQKDLTAKQEEWEASELYKRYKQDIAQNDPTLARISTLMANLPIMVKIQMETDRVNAQLMDSILRISPQTASKQSASKPTPPKPSHAASQEPTPQAPESKPVQTVRIIRRISNKNDKGWER